MASLISLSHLLADSFFLPPSLEIEREKSERLTLDFSLSHSDDKDNEGEKALDSQSKGQDDDGMTG